MTDREWQREFKYRLKKLMHQNGDMSQKDLAIASGVEEHTISRYITMSRKPTVDIVVKLSRALHCTPNDLIFFDNDDELMIDKYDEI